MLRSLNRVAGYLTGHLIYFDPDHHGLGNSCGTEFKGAFGGVLVHDDLHGGDLPSLLR
jgi:hypothetical protein